MIGHNDFTYTVDKGWGNLDPSAHPVSDCHEMVMDASGRLYLLTNNIKNNVLVYDKAGHLLGAWGNTYPGAHGLSISNENGEQFLYISDIVRHQIIKTTLQGREIMVLDFPPEPGLYAGAEQFLPTETVVAPNGDIYVTDGYGLQYIIQYSPAGQYIRHWGGRGPGPAHFDCAHGIAWDARDENNPVLLITSRNENALKIFTPEGKYLSSVYLPGSFVCRPVVKGDHIYAAVFRSVTNTNSNSGYITILDRNNRVVSTPGGTAPVYENGLLLPQQQADDTFMHPHDVCVDDEGSIYVAQWKSDNTYPVKLTRTHN